MRHGHDLPEPLELEVDLAPQLVDPHPHRHRTRQQRGQHGPRLRQGRGEQDVVGRDGERGASIGEIALRVDQGAELGAVVEHHRELDRSRPRERALVAHERDAERAVPRRPRTRLGLVQEAQDAAVGAQVPRLDRAFEHQPRQRRGATQRDVDLSRREHATRQVDDQTVERLALALVDRDGPRKLDRQLRVGAHDLAPQRPALDHGLGDVPRVGAERHARPVGQLGVDLDLAALGIAAQVGDAGQGAVDPPVGLVVREHHDLRPDLDPQHGVGGRVESRDVPRLDRVHLDEIARQPLEPLPVARRDDRVGRRQRQPELVLRRLEVGVDAGVELGLRVLEQHALAHRVEQRRQTVVAELAEHRGERDRGKAVAVERVRREEVRRLVVRREVLGRTVLDDRRKLQQVTHEHDLHPAERLALARPEALERRRDHVEHIGAHHRRLVDHECLQRPDRLHEPARAVGAGADVVQVRRGLEAEQAVDRVALDVERRDARGRGDHDTAVGGLEEVPHERRLAGARLAREEQVLAGLEELQRPPEVVGDRQRHDRNLPSGATTRSWATRGDRTHGG